MTWCKDLVDSMTPGDVSFESLIETASEAPGGSDGLFFLPYMLGERARGNTDARGAFVGITLDHKAPHLIRSVMEGVALAMGRDTNLLRGLGLAVDRVFCTGRWRSQRPLEPDQSEYPRSPRGDRRRTRGRVERRPLLLGASGVGLIEDLVSCRPGAPSHRQDRSTPTEDVRLLPKRAHGVQ